MLLAQKHFPLSKPVPVKKKKKKKKRIEFFDKGGQFVRNLNNFANPVLAVTAIKARSKFYF